MPWWARRAIIVIWKRLKPVSQALCLRRVVEELMRELYTEVDTRIIDNNAWQCGAECSHVCSGLSDALHMLWWTMLVIFVMFVSMHDT